MNRWKLPPDKGGETFFVMSFADLRARGGEDIVVEGWFLGRAFYAMM